MGRPRIVKEKQCFICGTTFSHRPSMLNDKYCSIQCCGMARRKKIPERKILEDLYFQQKLSTNQLAKFFDVSKGIIYNWFKKYEIKCRTNSEGVTIAQTGIPHSDEHRKNISKAHLKKGLDHHLCGRKHPFFSKPFDERHFKRTKGGYREDLGIYVRSRWEANFARYLNFLKSQKQILGWEFEPETFYFLEVKRGTRSYTPDFKIIENDGSHYWVEVKGFMDPKSLTKIKRFRKYYPQHELRLIDKKWFAENGKKLHSLIPGWEMANQFRRPSHEKLESMFRLQV